MLRSSVKYTNTIISGYSYLVSSFTRRAYIKGMPVAIGVELTNHCNLNCPECNSGSGTMKRNRGYLSLDLFDKIVNELGSFLWNMNLYFQGEPMLHPKFFTILKKSQGLKCTVSTNGHFINRENAEKIATSGLNKLIISIDGMDQGTYSSYRKNGSLDTVIEGITVLSEAKKALSSPIKIELQFLVNRLNVSQIPQVIKLSERTGAILKLKSMQVINPGSEGIWMPEIEKFRRYEKKNGGYIIKNRLPDRCARLWFNPVITWDGKVVPCCFDKDADHVMGDINEESFRDIWDGPRYRIFRKSILTGRDTIDICRNCTSGMRGVVT